MKILKIAAGVIVVVLLVLAMVAPLGPIPGFFIGGQESAVPDTWPDTRDVHEIQLAVGEGLLPRVVIIWVVQVEGSLYVVGAKDSGWTSRIGAGGPVKMRLGDNTYALQASAVTEGWEPILEAYVAKYSSDYPDIVAGFPQASEAANTTAVFRLE